MLIKNNNNQPMDTYFLINGYYWYHTLVNAIPLIRLIRVDFLILVKCVIVVHLTHRWYSQWIGLRGHLQENHYIYSQLHCHRKNCGCWLNLGKSTIHGHGFNSYMLVYQTHMLHVWYTYHYLPTFRWFFSGKCR